MDACGLAYDETIPVIGMITRLTDQKGIDLVVNSIKEIMIKKFK